MDLSNLWKLDLDWPAIADLFGFLVRRKFINPEEVIQSIGVDGLVEKVGREKVVQAIRVNELLKKAGREKVLAALLPNLTKEQIQKLIEQNSDGGTESAFAVQNSEG